jgi:hypothetical protein
VSWANIIPKERAISTGTKVALPLGVVLTLVGGALLVWMRDAAVPRIATTETAVQEHSAAIKDHGDRLIRLEEREAEQRQKLEKMDTKLDKLLDRTAP